MWTATTAATCWATCWAKSGWAWRAWGATRYGIAILGFTSPSSGRVHSSCCSSGGAGGAGRAQLGAAAPSTTSRTLEVIALHHAGSKAQAEEAAQQAAPTAHTTCKSGRCSRKTLTNVKLPACRKRSASWRRRFRRRRRHRQRSTWCCVRLPPARLPRLGRPSRSLFRCGVFLKAGRKHGVGHESHNPT